MKFQIIKSNVAILIFGILLAGLLMAGGGYEDILKSNMIDAGMTEEQAQNALLLPRNYEGVLVVDLGDPFVPPCTIAIIAEDGMSGYAIVIKDTIWSYEIFNLWDKIKK